MRLLIPDGEVKDVAKFTGLSESLIYQERRHAGESFSDTGTRNTIDRLDLFCEHALDTNPQAVQMLGERYINMFFNHTSPLSGDISIRDFMRELGEVSKECGEALAALSTCESLRDCSVEVAEAKNKLEHALRMAEIILSNEVK